MPQSLATSCDCLVCPQPRHCGLTSCQAAPARNGLVMLLGHHHKVPLQAGSRLLAAPELSLSHSRLRKPWLATYALLPERGP